MIHHHQIRVRYGETDKMAVVHHSVYPLYVEEARTELMRAIGLRYSELEGDGFLLPLTDIGIRFLKGPRYDDLLDLEARLTEATRLRLRIDYRMRNAETGELLAEGYTRHVSTGPELKPRRLPRDVAKAFEDALEPGEEEADRSGRPRPGGGA